jgi:hypothetical protein
METKLKVCKVCNEEKPVKEFNNHGLYKGELFYDNTCKVCQWFKSRDIMYNEKWIEVDDRLIIDSLLNNKRNINEISKELNKPLSEVCSRIKNVLKLSGKIKLPVILICKNCNKE